MSFSERITDKYALVDVRTGMNVSGGTQEAETDAFLRNLANDSEDGGREGAMTICMTS